MRELPGVVRGSKSLEGRMETLGNSQLCPGLGSRKVDAETRGSSDVVHAVWVRGWAGYSRRSLLGPLEAVRTESTCGERH